jgi:hypothetical protein
MRVGMKHEAGSREPYVRVSTGPRGTCPSGVPCRTQNAVHDPMHVRPHPQIMADASLTCYFEVDIVPYFRRAYGQVAATCATLSDAIRHRARGGATAVGCSVRFGSVRGAGDGAGLSQQVL